MFLIFTTFANSTKRKALGFLYHAICWNVHLQPNSTYAAFTCSPPPNRITYWRVLYRHSWYPLTPLFDTPGVALFDAKGMLMSVRSVVMATVINAQSYSLVQCRHKDNWVRVKNNLLAFPLLWTFVLPFLRIKYWCSWVIIVFDWHPCMSHWVPLWHVRGHDRASWSDTLGVNTVWQHPCSVAAVFCRITVYFYWRKYLVSYWVRIIRLFVLD